MISKILGDNPFWSVDTDKLDEGMMIDFDDLLELQKVVNQLVSDEQSRLLQESLSGDFICDGCTI
ncbi:hypothetical protein PQC59_gp039 [Escherichia phage vB_EcoP_IMEP8]|uniref:Uncharacterized protein n=1 Tax=Escherichia phage vB_EcoP_IMEP8 TaxID=2866663 RepID=A0AAE9C1E8_9CAUD|nr:hypothetical protein PQC59_gp039 [Escherichia phage vB_EcoP_IMEP8]UCR91960.1 hypothetical protein [Escherichia phage vB_EcoP_IMEP8]